MHSHLNTGEAMKQNETQIQIQDSLLKHLLLKNYFERVSQVQQNILAENSSISSEYETVLNNIVTEKVINISDETMRNLSATSANEKMPRIERCFSESSRQVLPQDKFISERTNAKKLLQIMRNEEYIAGEIPESEKYVRTVLAEIGPERTMFWLTHIYETNFDKPAILIGLLHILSHFSYSTVSPNGPIMALALLQHRSASVREFAIKAFENWNSKQSLMFLRNIKCDQQWLQDYLEEVIRDIES